MAIAEYLKNQVPFLSGIAEVDAAELAGAAEILRFAPGRSILMQGVTVDGLHVIASGKVSVSVKLKGKEPQVVAELGPGKVLGEASIMEDTLAGATVRAVVETEVYVLPQEAFKNVLERHPEVKERILAAIAKRRAPPPAAAP